FDRLLYLMKKSKLYFHPLAGEPFGISIAEAMASGLIPIVPAVGGSTEFVPSEYQYHSIREASDIISNILNKINDDKYINTVERSLEISNRVSIFSIQSYKRNLKNIIDYVSKTSKIEEAVILNKKQTRIPETN
ncbi:MAG: glycosyltransferase, partial [Candidatus Nitrosopolaris sp.]